MGNSIKSDVNPALKLGLKAIWLKGSCWDYDIEQVGTGKIWEINRLDQIPLIIDKESKRKLQFKKKIIV